MKFNDSNRCKKNDALLRHSALMLALAGIFSLGSGIARADEAACTAMGGTMENGVCFVKRTSMDSGKEPTVNTDLALESPVTVTEDTIVQGVKEWTAQFVIADGIENTFTITNGADVKFMGGEDAEGAMGVYALSLNGGNGTLNVENGSLTISGRAESFMDTDNAYAYGLYAFSCGSSAKAEINVKSGSKLHVDWGGAYAFATGGASAVVNVAQGGSLTTGSLSDFENNPEAFMSSGMPIAKVTDADSKLQINNAGTVYLLASEYGNLNIKNEGSYASLTLAGLDAGVTASGDEDDIVLENTGGAIADVAFTGKLSVVNDSESRLTIRKRQSDSDAAGTHQYISRIENSGIIDIYSDVLNPVYENNATSTIINNKSGKITFHDALLYREGNNNNIVNVDNFGSMEIGAALAGSMYGMSVPTTNRVVLTNGSGAVLTFNDQSNYLVRGSGDVKIDNQGTVKLTENSLSCLALVQNSAYDNVHIEYVNQSAGTTSLYAKNMFEIKKSGEVGALPISVLSLSDGQWKKSSITVEGFESDTAAADWQLMSDWAKYSFWKEGGTLLVNDVVAGSKAAQQMQSAFTAAFGTGTNIQFLGKDDWASGEIVTSDEDGSVFNVDVVKKIIEAGHAGAIVTNFRLSNASADGSAQSLTVGSGAGQVITTSFGFQGIDGATDVTVNNGQTLALIGTSTGGALVGGDAPIVLDHGTLMLGVTQVDSSPDDPSTAGSLEKVTMKNGSHVNADNMWIQADSITGEGAVSLTETGRMHVRELALSGDISNSGTLSADALTISKGKATTSKTLKSSGKITVESTASLAVDGILAADEYDIKGVVKLGKNAQVYSGGAALEQMRLDHADAAAELDRVEGKAAVSAMSLLESVDDEAAATAAEADEPDQGTDGESAAVASSGSKGKVRPSAAQAFAAFDAVSRVAADIESGASADRHGLWVKLQANDGRFGVVERGGTFDVDAEGAVVGAEAALADGVKLGAALSYLDGEIEASGLKNNWTSWGLHLYGAYRADAFALKGSAGWLTATTEAEKDLDADVWHAGLRAEYGVPAGGMMVTPFLGARVMSGSFDGLDSQTAFSVPLGAKLSGTIEAAGWTLTPVLEAAYVRSIGDTEAEDIRFLPKDAVRGSVGLKAEKGMWSGELAYAGATGSNDYRSNSLHVKIGLRF